MVGYHIYAVMKYDSCRSGDRITDLFAEHWQAQEMVEFLNDFHGTDDYSVQQFEVHGSKYLSDEIDHIKTNLDPWWLRRWKSSALDYWDYEANPPTYADAWYQHYRDRYDAIMNDSSIQIWEQMTPQQKFDLDLMHHECFVAYKNNNFVNYWDTKKFFNERRQR